MKLRHRIINIFSPKLAKKWAFNYFYSGISPYRNKIVSDVYNQFFSKSEESAGIQQLRDKSRFLNRNTANGRAFVNTHISSTISNGLYFQSEIDNNYLKIDNDKAVEIQNEIERRFNNWAKSKNCDISRDNNFYQLQALAFKTMLLSGDCFITLPFEQVGKKIKINLGVYEAEDVGGPDNDFTLNNQITDFENATIQGITYKNGRARVYNFKLNGRDVFIKKYKDNGLPNCLHLFIKERPGQIRGIPYLAPVLEEFSNLAKFTKAEILGAMITSLFTAFITSENQEEEAMNNFMKDESSNSDSTSSTEETGYYKLEAGNIQEMQPGQKIEMAESKRPNKNFGVFYDQVSHEIGAALGLPYELVKMKFEDSYSASRAALTLAYEKVKQNRSWFVTDFCEQVLSIWMFNEVMNNGLELPGFLENEDKRNAYLGARWIGSVMPNIDPYKEARAATERINLGITTTTEETRQFNGGDFQRNIETIQKENELKEKAGLRKNIDGTEAALISEN